MRIRAGIIWSQIAAIILFTVFVFLAASEEQPKPTEEWRVKGVRAALQDSVTEVRILALNRINQSDLNWQGSLESTILTFLKDPNPELRSAAVAALGSMESKEHIGDVAGLLEDLDPMVRSEALLALGDMQAEKYADKVANFLHDSDDEVRSAAAVALGEMRAKNHAIEVLELLKDHSSAVRHYVTIALGAMEANDQVVGEVVGLLKNPNPYIRSDAVRALGEMQAKEQSEKIAERLNDPDFSVRGAAAWALGEMEADDQTEKVIKVLKDPARAVRDAAAEALGYLHSDLVALWEEVRAKKERSIMNGGQELAPVRIAVQMAPENETSALAARVLGVRASPLN